MENSTIKPLEESEFPQGQRVLLFHGFSREELMLLINLLNSHSQVPRDIIMATTTETSLNWSVADLLAELAKEHEYFKKQRQGEK